jgi:hypothetical protein
MDLADHVIEGHDLAGHQLVDPGRTASSSSDVI